MALMTCSRHAASHRQLAASRQHRRVPTRRTYPNCGRRVRLRPTAVHYHAGSGFSVAADDSNVATVKVQISSIRMPCGCCFRCLAFDVKGFELQGFYGGR